MPFIDLNTFGLFWLQSRKFLGHHIVHWRGGGYIGALQSVVNIPARKSSKLEEEDKLSLYSDLLNTERFWVNLSLFLVSRFLSMPSMRFSNQVIIAPRLSVGWEEITWSRKFWKIKIKIIKLEDMVETRATHLEVFFI